MSRRARRNAQARPWLQQRDSTHPVEDSLQVAASPDERTQERAWQQREVERDQQQRDTA